MEQNNSAGGCGCLCVIAILFIIDAILWIVYLSML